MSQLDRIEDMLSRLCAHLGCDVPEYEASEKPKAEAKPAAAAKEKPAPKKTPAKKAKAETAEAPAEEADEAPATVEELSAALVKVALELGDGGREMVKPVIAEFAKKNGGTKLVDIAPDDFAAVLAKAKTLKAGE